LLADEHTSGGSSVPDEASCICTPAFDDPAPPAGVIRTMVVSPGPPPL
jgi:hypothetical protein